ATEFGVIRPVIEAQILVLDDLGAEKTSEWVEETMNLIINTRYNERRLTVFTTNYLDRDPDEKSLAEVLVERVGFRIHSRLHEMCEFINMKAIDYRKAGDDTSPETLDRLEKHGRSVANGGLPTRARPARARLREPDEIARIIGACTSAFDVAAGGEVTMEANPESVTEARLAAYRRAGVNRVSFGVQSFREEELKRLSRLHSVDRARAAFGEARA